jgi:small-conductance mechanosensitive channel
MIGEKILNTKHLYELLDLEPFFILCSLILLAWVFYKVFLQAVSDERHRNLQTHFKNLVRHFLVFLVWFATFTLLHQLADDPTLLRALPYVAMACLFWGMTVFVKACRLIILQYLFLGSMKHGVPVLVVNIFSLLLSLILALWVAASIFNFELTPLLATSAAFSVILGLALQDTLGNLFAGISLQVDKAFDIGDWLEVTNGSQKTVGQVKEITWRATVLGGWTDELITLPNRLLANSQIANFSVGDQPIIRSQNFRLPYSADSQLTKHCLVDSLKDIKSVRSWPEPLVLMSEMSESWVTYKMIYYIENFGSQYSIADQVVESALRYLRANNLEPAPARLAIERSRSSTS